MIVIRTLGTTQIDVGDSRVVPTSPRKFALLLYLAVERNRRVLRKALQELIFPDQSEKNAQHSLRELLYQLRQAGVHITSSAEGLQLLDDNITSDLEAFIAADRLAIEQLSAVEGGFLPAYAPEYSEALTEWLEGYRARSTFELCKALVADIVRSRRVGDWTRTEQAARACLGLDTLNEEATLGLAEALAMGGAKAKAIELLDRYAAEVDQGGRRLQLPATMLRRRISERVKDVYRAPLTLPFLGRDGEMGKLSDCFDRVRRGEGHCAVIVGDPGIGKSRLAEEFCAGATLDGAIVETVVTQRHDAHRPMSVIAELIPKLLQLPGALGCSPASLASLRRLTTPDLSGEVSYREAADGEAVASSITRANADLIDAITSEVPLILFVDDAQWADELSLQAILTLASARRPRRLLALLTSRNRLFVQRLAQSTERVVPIDLGPLRLSSAKEVINRVISHDSLDATDEMREWFLRTSGGHPFFLRCLIAHFQSTGERFVVPTSINTLLDQQLAGLSNDALVLLGVAMALGRHSTGSRLLAAVELPFLRLQASIRELEAAHLVVQQEKRVEPAHWLIAEAVERTTPPIAMQLIHRRVAITLEEDVDTIPGALAWDCAEHWVLAGENARAVALMTRYANYSLDIGRPREAAETLLRAATLLETDYRSQLIAKAIQIGAKVSENDLVLRAVRFAQEHAVKVSYDGFELDHLLARMAEWDDIATAKKALQPWLLSGTPLHHRLRAAMVGLIAAEESHDSSFAHDVYASMETVLAEGARNDDPGALKVLLIYHSRFGDIGESIRVAHRLLTLAATRPLPECADLRRKAAVALLGSGDLDGAIAAAEGAYDSAKECGLVRLQAHMAGLLATVMLQTGQVERCAEWLEKVEESADDVDGFRASLTYITLLADIGASIGDAKLTRHWVDAGSRVMPRRPAIRARRWLRALEIRANQLENRFGDADDVVAKMIMHHRPNAELGDLSDLEVAVAMAALVAAHRPSDAETLLDRYLRDFRRVPGPLTANLRGAARLIGRDESGVSAPDNIRTTQIRSRLSAALAFHANRPTPF